MGQQELMSINTVARRLGLSVHQLRRWELMFGLEIKRGRGQQRQYRPEDLTVLERIKELVEQGWPTSQIRPQIEAEGLITPKLIGLPPQPGNPEVLQESLIGLRNFTERRFHEISRQIDELRQLVISMTLKQELQADTASPWKPVLDEPLPMPLPARKPAEEIAIGPSVSPPLKEAVERAEDRKPELDEITDQNYLMVVGKALDLIGWSDEQADEFSQDQFGIAHWDELGRSEAERLVEHLKSLRTGTSDPPQGQSQDLQPGSTGGTDQAEISDFRPYDLPAGEPEEGTNGPQESTEELDADDDYSDADLST